MLAGRHRVRRPATRAHLAGPRRCRRGHASSGARTTHLGGRQRSHCGQPVIREQRHTSTSNTAQNIAPAAVQSCDDQTTLCPNTGMVASWDVSNHSRSYGETGSLPLIAKEHGRAGAPRAMRIRQRSPLRALCPSRTLFNIHGHRSSCHQANGRHKGVPESRVRSTRVHVHVHAHAHAHAHVAAPAAGCCGTGQVNQRAWERWPVIGFPCGRLSALNNQL